MVVTKVGKITGDGRDQTLASRLSWLIVAAITLILPVIVCVSGKDAFRLPKELLLKAGGIALIGVALCGLILSKTRSPNRPPNRELWRVVTLAVGVVLIWSAISTLTSTNRPLSIASLSYAVVAAAYFVTTAISAENRSLSAIYLVIIPGVVNSALVILQRFEVWSPIRVDATGRLATTALIGNPDDVGMAFVAPAVAAAVLATASQRHRPVATICAVMLLIGLVASETLGAIAAVLAALFLLFVRIRPRTTVAVAVITLLAAAGVIRLSPSRWELTRTKFAAAAHGDLDPLLSGRVPAFLAAWRMFGEHPLMGVGIGCFKYHYFDQKIAVEAEHPWLLNRSVMNFGEAHNEHLQVLAEGGIPAYLIFITLLSVLARRSFSGRGEGCDERRGFSRRLALPMAIAVFTLALTAFPFRLAAPTENILFCCALVFSWSDDGGA